MARFSTELILLIRMVWMSSTLKPKPGDVIEAGFGALVCTYEFESEYTFIYGEPDHQTVSYFNAMYNAWKAGLSS